MMLLIDTRLSVPIFSLLYIQMSYYYELLRKQDNLVLLAGWYVREVSPGSLSDSSRPLSCSASSPPLLSLPVWSRGGRGEGRGCGPSGNRSVFHQSSLEVFFQNPCPIYLSFQITIVQLIIFWNTW